MCRALSEARASTTLPKAESEVLITTASWKRRPSDWLRARRSEPAKSTKLIMLPTTPPLALRRDFCTMLTVKMVCERELRALRRVS